MVDLVVQPGETQRGVVPEIHFPEGLVGLEQWKRFVLVADSPEEPIQSLQSLDEPAISFWVVDPYLVLPEFEFELPDADATLLDVKDLSHLIVRVILTVRENGVTANLLGPLAINTHTRLAKQLVLADSGYSARHLIPITGEASAGAAESGEPRRAVP